MGAIFSLLFLLLFATFVIRTATAALTLTGLSRDLARFQAISAFTGVGFTTAESESLLNHPARRKVVMLLMIVGNIGIVTAASSLVLSFSDADAVGEKLRRALWLSGGLVVLAVSLFNRFVDVRLHRALRTLLRKSGRVALADYVDLLHLSTAFSVTELVMHSEHWLVGRRLSDSNLSKEGMTVLGIQRANGEFIGVPRGETEVEDDDRLILYGKEAAIEELGERRRDAEGDVEHAEAVDEVRRERAELAWLEHRRRVEEEAEEKRRLEEQGDEPVGVGAAGAAGETGETGEHRGGPAIESPAQGPDAPA